MALLRPLLLDNVPRHAAGRICPSASFRPSALARARGLTCRRPRSIQQSAAVALGRLANHSDELAEAVVSNEILPQLVRPALYATNRFTPCAAWAAQRPQHASVRSPSCFVKENTFTGSATRSPRCLCPAALPAEATPRAGVLPERAEPLLQEGCRLRAARGGEALSAASTGAPQSPREMPMRSHNAAAAQLLPRCCAAPARAAEIRRTGCCTGGRRVRRPG